MKKSYPPGWEIPNELKARLSDTLGRQRTMTADGHIVMVLHKAPKARALKREGVLFWRHPDGGWKCDTGGKALARLDELLDDYKAAVAKLDKMQERADESAAWFKILEEATPLHRAARNLYETLQKARKEIPDVERRIEMQGPCDVASDVARETELFQVDAKNALEFCIAKQNEVQERLGREMARASHRLNLMAAVFLPIATLAGLFGMKIPNGLENAPVSVFWSVLCSSVLLSGFLCAYMLSASASSQKELEESKSLRKQW